MNYPLVLEALGWRLVAFGCALMLLYWLAQREERP